MRTRFAVVVAAMSLAATPLASPAQTTTDAPARRPEAIVDLATEEGLRLVRGQWRYSDVASVDGEHRGPGADLRASGPPNRAYDISPHAGGAGFDDSAWAVLPASQLTSRRTAGRLSFNWYRIKITIPDRVGRFDPTGSTV